MCHPAVIIGAQVLSAVQSHNAKADAYGANANAAIDAKVLEDQAVNEDLALKQQAAEP